MPFLGHQLVRLGTGLALLATLALGILPSGLMPKAAGPCGRELCNCPLEVTERFDSQGLLQKHVHHACALHLVPTTVSNPAAPATAFQLVITGVMLPPAVHSISMLVNEDNSPIQSPAIAFSEPSFDIPTPPPRA